MSNTLGIDDLLEEIASKIGLNYLSDLHRAYTNGRISEALPDVPYDKYQTSEWVKAVRYIIKDEALTPVSEKEARELLSYASADK